MNLEISECVECEGYGYNEEQLDVDHWGPPYRCDYCEGTGVAITADNEDYVLSNFEDKTPNPYGYAAVITPQRIEWE